MWNFHIEHYLTKKDFMKSYLEEEHVEALVCFEINQELTL